MVGVELEDIRQYLSEIGMGLPLVERSEEVLAKVMRFFPGRPEFFFVSEYRDEEGNRHYESLWVFGEKVVSEAAEFVTTVEFDMVAIEGGVIRLVIDSEEFEFEEAKENSRLLIDADLSSTGHGLEGNFKATGSNCTHLQEILERYLIPRLTSVAASETGTH